MSGNSLKILSNYAKQSEAYGEFHT